MTEKELKIEVDKGIHSLIKIAHLSASVIDNQVISDAGKEYVKKISGISIDFIEALIDVGVKIA